MELYEYDYEKYTMKEKIVNKLSTEMYYAKKNRGYLDIVFLCIGTDRMTGDCFGPLVGSKLEELLKNYNIFNINIYGTLTENVNYTNIDKILEIIKKKHLNPYIIVIDAALSKKENIGKVYIDRGKTILGKGLNKNKIEIGNLSIKAVVGKDYKLPKHNFSTLQNISLNMVIRLSNMVSEAIVEAIKYT